MRWSIQIMRCFGIPVRVHVTLLVLLPYFAVRLAEPLGLQGAVWGWVAAAGVWSSILAHEFGHVLTARRMGCATREITLWPIGGVASLESIPRRPRDEALMAAMGPVVSLVLAALGLGAGYALEPSQASLAALLGLLGAVNLSLAVFNLLPCFPMDGGRIYRAWLASRMDRVRATQRAVRLGRWMAFALAAGGFWYSQWTVVLIAFFMWRAGAAELRQIMRDTLRERGMSGFSFGPLFVQTFSTGGRPQGAPPLPREADVEVGPAPYER